MIKLKKYLGKLVLHSMLISSSIVFGQISIVKGTVVDDSGMPMLGATIVVEGTENGVTTDFDGNYLINVKKENATLIFSYIGYETQKISIEDRTVINVIMKEDLNALEEVQVVAFSKQKKKFSDRICINN